jgi:polyisoprenoid-binding protein YceI
VKRACIVTASMLLYAQPSAPHPATDVYRVDPARSTVTIAVGKAGALSFVAGHTHQVSGPIASGTVELDRERLTGARLRLIIAAADLKVSRTHESADDVPKIQETMDGEQVLAIDRYRDVTFESTRVAASVGEGTPADLIVEGSLTIRGVAQPVSVPVHVDFAGDALTAIGHFAVKQSAFGIKPVAVGGVVAVKDELQIRFSITAVRKS